MAKGDPNKPGITAYIKGGANAGRGDIPHVDNVDKYVGEWAEGLKAIARKDPKYQERS